MHQEFMVANNQYALSFKPFQLTHPMEDTFVWDCAKLQSDYKTEKR